MTRDADRNFSDLITLDDACKHFLGGKVTVATLRAQHKMQNLEIYRIGRRDFTTISDLKQMQEKCRVAVQDPSSGSTRPVKRGPSSTAESAAAQAAAQMRLQERKKLLGITSRRNGQ